MRGGLGGYAFVKVSSNGFEVIAPDTTTVFCYASMFCTMSANSSSHLRSTNRIASA